MTRDQTITHKTITLEQFAKRVANAVGRFLDVSSPLPPRLFGICVVVIALTISIDAGGPAT
jgi:hypothetical protein